MTDHSGDGLAAWRATADREGLAVDDLDADPVMSCRAWLQHARDLGVFEPDGASLATVNAEGRPTARAVLVRGIDATGFAFYTNYTSAKGADLDRTGVGSLHFLWPALRRQIRVEGTVRRSSTDESDAYFAGRPRDRQLAAWASDQSAEVASRAALDEAFRDVQQRFEGQTVPRPRHWGGYRLRPDAIEFWQGRETRLHDRLRYVRSGDVWVVSRIAP